MNESSAQPEKLSHTKETGVRRRVGGTAKRAACLACKRSKIKCDRNSDDVTCKRCHQMNLDCVIPVLRIGRRHGSKNKRTGLDLAVHRLDRVFERSKEDGVRFVNKQTVAQVQVVLRKMQGLLSEGMEFSDPSPEELLGLSPQYSGSSQTEINSASPTTGSFSRDGSLCDYTLDDAENPLQLFAGASNLPVSQNVQANSINYTPPDPSPYLKNGNSGGQSLEHECFFGPFIPCLQLDIGEHIDPIDIGYVTPCKADALFTYFYENLAHTRWGLDPSIHTAVYVRARSAFLFTSIMAASALFIPSAAALSKRLSAHSKKLADYVISNRIRSVEVVLAFIINIPWMSPGRHWADDATCTYMAHALSIALDLSLDKLIVPSPSTFHGLDLKLIGKSNCITAKKALSLDFSDDVDPGSSWGQRLIRQRERTWLVLFALDRGVCLARGRRFIVPMTPLIEICDKWHTSDMQDVWDETIVSSTVLRRDLVGLIENIKSSCDFTSGRMVDETATTKSIEDMVENFFDCWYGTWAFTQESDQERHLPPYLDILVSHVRLSTYGSVINHPTAPMQVKRYFHAAGLSSALSVLRAAVQGEAKMRSMPNNTAIMISFAASFALSLLTVAIENHLSLAPSISVLIDETANVLERTGRVTRHRNGLSTVCGRHLRQIFTTTSERLNRLPPSDTLSSVTSISQDPTHGMTGCRNDRNSGHEDMAPLEPLPPLVMSDHQIVEAFNHARNELGILPMFQGEEDIGLYWQDWANVETGFVE